MRVLLVDDHPLTAEAVGRVLEELFGAGLNLTHVLSPQDALDVAERSSLPFELCITDLVFLRGPEVHFVIELRRQFMAMPVLVYSGVTDPVVVRSVLDAGALAYVPKRKSPEILKNAVRNVLAGDGYVPPELLVARPESAPSGPAIPELGLNAREREIVELMARLASRKAVARITGLSHHTVKMYLLRSYRRLGVSNAEDAQRTIARHAAELGGVRP